MVIKINLQKKNQPSLRNRILFTLSLLAIIRVGNFILIPYIDQELFTNLTKENNLILSPFSSFLTSFSSSKTPALNLFSLGILPYINASIFIQLLTNIFPELAKLSKDEGEYGRRKIKKYTRFLTLLCAIIEAIGTTYNIKSFVFEWNFIIASQIILSLISGSMIMLWFSELITKDGLKNGPSLLICFNIIANLPDQLIILTRLFNNENTYKIILDFIILIITYRFIVAGCVLQNEGVLQIPLTLPNQRLKHLKLEEENYIVQENNLPLRVNQSGVMPVVITSSLMTILSSFLGGLKFQLTRSDFLFSNILKVFSSSDFINKFFFCLIYAILLFFFTKFYSKIVLNPRDISEELRKKSVIIRNINPGRETQQYLTQIIEYLAKVNAIIFMSLIILLEILYKFLNIQNLNTNGFGLTSQIILINVSLETYRIIKTLYFSEKEIIP